MMFLMTSWSSAFFFILLNINRIQSATHVGGVLLHNTVWSAAGLANPYYLLSDLQIPLNVTLTISPGVVVSFARGDFEILVEGFLRVDGTSENPVVFRGGTTNSQNWMIHFQSTQLSLSSISHSHFIGPKKALQLVDVPDGIQENSGTLLIQSSIFSDYTEIDANGNYPRSSNPSVPSLRFLSCVFNKTTILSQGRESEPITISNSEIYDSTFYPRAANEGMQIANCNLINIIFNYAQAGYLSLVQIDNSNMRGISVQAKDATSIYQFIVRQSIVENFVLSYGIYGYSYPTNVTFEDSILSSVSISTTYYTGVNYGSGYTVIIRNCVYNDGNLDFSNMVSLTLVLIQNSQLHKVNIIQRSTAFNYMNLQNRKLVIYNSTFFDGSIGFENGQSEISYSKIVLGKPPLSLNGTSLIICSTIDRSDSIPQANTTGVFARDLRIFKSTIKNFQTGLYIALTSIYTVNMSLSNFIDISGFNIENRGPYDILVSDIYWGTNNSETITSKIVDYWDDIKYGHVISSNDALSPLSAEQDCSSQT